MKTGPPFSERPRVTRAFAREALGRLGDLGDRAKACRIVHREIREDLAIDGNLRLGETRDQLRVRQTDRPSRRVDADDPKRAEVALATLTIARGVIERTLDGLVRTAVAVLTAAAETLGQLQD